MRAVNLFKKAFRFNPIVETIFELRNISESEPIPPTSKFILGEDGITQIISEDGNLLITES